MAALVAAAVAALLLLFVGIPVAQGQLPNWRPPANKSDWRGRTIYQVVSRTRHRRAHRVQSSARGVEGDNVPLLLLSAPCSRTITGAHGPHEASVSEGPHALPERVQ